MFEPELRARLAERAQAYGLSKLADDAGLSRQAIHAFLNGGDVRLSSLLSLVKSLNMDLRVEEEPTSDDDVLSNLKKHGAVVVVGTEPRTPMTYEESVARALGLLGHESRLCSVLPHLFVKRAFRFDANKLLNHLRGQPRQIQLLGYLLDVALAYRKRAPLANLKRRLKGELREMRPLMLRDRDQGKSLADFDRFDNLPAKEWKVGTRDNLQSLVDRCRKWEALLRRP